MNQAMNQLEQVTQQNASSAEELASTAEELSSQAESLEKAVAFFHVDDYSTRGEIKREKKKTVVTNHAPAARGAVKESPAVESKVAVAESSNGEGHALESAEPVNLKNFKKF
jgi:methyl-accepting chemotaxis protein